MKHQDCTILEVIEATNAINRAGRRAGVTPIAKICGISNGRAKTLLQSAIRRGIIYTYGHSYRSNVSRCCYSLTEGGKLLFDVIEDNAAYSSMIDALMSGDNE